MVVTIRTKGDLVLQDTAKWKVEPTGPRDCDFTPGTFPALPPGLVNTVYKIEVTVVPLRAGTKHVAFSVGGSVCDAEFCDVVAEQVSLNLDVK